MRVRARYGLLLCAAVLSFAACDRPLEIPSDGGPDASLPSVDGSGGGDLCHLIDDDSRCDAQLACHSLRSGDLPCEEESCSDHFIACVPGPAACTPPKTTEKCYRLTHSCRTGDTLNFGDGICPDGCASRSKCVKTDT